MHITLIANSCTFLIIKNYFTSQTIVALLITKTRFMHFNQPKGPPEHTRKQRLKQIFMWSFYLHQELANFYKNLLSNVEVASVLFYYRALPFGTKTWKILYYNNRLMKDNKRTTIHKLKYLIHLTLALLKATEPLCTISYAKFMIPR